MQRIVFLLLILTFAWWFWSLRRAATLFTVHLEHGRVTRVKGRIPPRLLADITDVAGRSGVVRAVLRGVMREGRPILHFDGEIDPAAQQQLRNVMGQFSASEIRGGRKSS